MPTAPSLSNVPPAVPSPQGEVLVLVAHPDMARSVVNRHLMRTAALAGPRVEVRDLYALYPDYLIDVEAERECLARARLVVWQHPIHWYGMPPLMKLWVDEVLGFGWAYGPGGTALRGKDLWLVASTGGTEDSYRPEGHNRYAFHAFLPPYEQTAVLCGLRFLPPWLLHGAHDLAASDPAAQAALYTDRLRSHPDWPKLAGLDGCPACDVPVNARPSDASSGRSI